MRHLRIGFAYDDISDFDGNPVSAEYEDARTLDWIRETLGRWGKVIDLPFSASLPEKILHQRPDIIFNITEAFGGRNRESLVPALSQMAGIPFTGSDAMALGLSLDKRLTKLLAHHAGVPTPEFVLLGGPEDVRENEGNFERIGYPLMAKPNCGGSSMGITRDSKVYSLQQLVEVTEWIKETIGDDILVERFIPGREYTTGLIETGTLIHLPVAETRFGVDGPESFYSIDMKSTHDKEVICPADCPPFTVDALHRYSEKIFRTLGCKDLARIDFRIDTAGNPYFLEINPLPGLSPFYSILPMQAGAAGMPPEDIIRQLLENNLPKQTGEMNERICELEMADSKQNSQHQSIKGLSSALP